MNYRKKFGVEPGNKVDLGRVDASFTDVHESSRGTWMSTPYTALRGGGSPR